MRDALDTGEPQGSPPTSSPEKSGSGGGGAGVDLDRLEAVVRLAGDPKFTSAVMRRVKALEAVAEAARRDLEAERQLDDSLHAETRDHLGRCTACMDAEAEALSARNAVRAALAAAGGGSDER